MASVIASKIVNGKKKTQHFSEVSWKLLGNNKNGWVSESDQSIDNAKEVVTAHTKQPKKDQVISNDLKKESQSGTEIKNDLDETVSEKKSDSKFSEEKVKEFNNHLEGLTKGSIKDHFDSLTPPVKYDNTLNLQGLKDLLGEHYKFDIINLQKSFTK